MTALARVPAKRATGPVRCASWCQDGTGHAAERLAADQYCYSIDGTVTVSLEPLVEVFDGPAIPAVARVYASQDPGEAPFVCLVNHDERGMNLTPTEARELAKQLNHYAWVAEEDQHRRDAFELGVVHGSTHPRKV